MLGVGPTDTLKIVLEVEVVDGAYLFVDGAYLKAALSDF